MRGDYLKEKIEILIEKLNIGLIEREEQIKIALLAVLTGENLLLIGPPGTGKSQLTRRISNAFNDSSYFEYLLTKFTTPEELFGPISIKELENDRFHRNTESYLTDSHIVFLDEVFKSNSAILNSLLTIMNERLYHNGYKREKIKTISILAASNELPDTESELDALYDRFLFRDRIDYVKDVNALVHLASEEPIINENEKIDFNDMTKFYSTLKNIELSPDISDKIINIKNKINIELNESISDRRLVKVIKVLKMAALLSGRNSVNDFDLLLLNYLFWTHEKSMDKIKLLINTEILNIESIDTGEMQYLFEKWNTHFNKFFSEQKKDNEGNLLFYDINKEITASSRGLIHVKDSTGYFIFYKGYRDYVKISNELGKFDHGYVDSGLRTMDKKKVWTYEFSAIEVISDFNEDVESFEKLTIEGNLEPVMITTFSEYYSFYQKSKEEFIKVFEEILKNIEYEYLKLVEVYDNLIKQRDYLEVQKSNVLWIPNSLIFNIIDTISSRVIECEKLKNSYNELIKDLRVAING